MEATRKLTRKEKIEQAIEKEPGSKKKRAADARKEARKLKVTATLANQPGSPRKYRMVIDLIRGKSVEHALAILKLTNRAATRPVAKLLENAIANWDEKFPEERADEEMLFVKTITADQSFMLKRIQPAPQGRAHRIRKRYTTLNVELARISFEEES